MTRVMVSSVAVLAVGLLSGCSDPEKLESTKDASTDVDSDSDTDSDSDSDTDTDADSDTDSTTGTEPECTSGVCCNDSTQTYLSSSTECDEYVEYRCDGGTCGANAQQRTVTQYCSGYSATCNGVLSEGSWSTIEGCDSDEKCETDFNSYANCTFSAYCCDGGSLDPDHNLCWQHPEADYSTWMDAMTYCNTLTLGGHTNWYLPSRQEFVDLLGGCDSDVLSDSFGYCTPCGDAEHCQAMFEGEYNEYWSSDEYLSYYWSVDLEDGYVHSAIYDSNYVRCVRPGP